MFLEDPPQRLEINIGHPVITGLYEQWSQGRAELANDVAQQVFDNALIAAGIMDDPRVMLKRLNRILEQTVPSNKSKLSSATISENISSGQEATKMEESTIKEKDPK